MSEIIKLSRSTVEKFLSCPRCCVLDKKYKIKPPSLPFTLNIAVDNLCKNEFDYYRKIQEPHPLFIEYGIDAVPFKHKNLELWRSNFQGIRYKSIQHKYDFGGAVDDIWQKKNGNLIIVDVKATSKNNFDWSETFNKYEYAKAYKRQVSDQSKLFLDVAFTSTIIRSPFFFCQISSTAPPKSNLCSTDIYLIPWKLLLQRSKSLCLKGTASIPYLLNRGCGF